MRGVANMIVSLPLPSLAPARAGSVEAYRAQVQDAYRNMKLKQAHGSAKQRPANKHARRHAANFKRKWTFDAEAFD